jgi:site-specific recombinase XerD
LASQRLKVNVKHGNLHRESLTAKNAGDADKNPRPRAKPQKDYLALFMQSRKAMNVTAGTEQFYRTKLGRFFSDVNVEKAKRYHIEVFLLQFKNQGNRHAYFRALRTFYNFREEITGIPSPMRNMHAPKLNDLILPTLTLEEVLFLISQTDNIRDKAIISLFTESGLRLSELADIVPEKINWQDRTVRVIGKGRREELAPFGELTEKYLKMWLAEYVPEENIWGLNMWGIISMLRRLKESTGLVCNPHVFRRTFACLLRRKGVDVMTIRDLGRWKSLEMVSRYTRAFDFKDSLKFYKGPLSD